MLPALSFSSSVLLIEMDRCSDLAARKRFIAVASVISMKNYTQRYPVNSIDASPGGRAFGARPVVDPAKPKQPIHSHWRRAYDARRQGLRDKTRHNNKKQTNPDHQTQDAACHT